MKRSSSVVGSMIGILVLIVLGGTLRVRSAPIQTPTRWLDNFEDDTGLHGMINTEVVTATGHLALAHSPINPDQYVTSGLATSVIINPLVAAVPSSKQFTSIAPGQGDFLYLSGGNELFSYQLSSGQFSRIHSLSTSSLATGIDGLVYMGSGDHLYSYNPSNGNLDDLGAPVPTSGIRKLAADPAGLIYGIAGLRLFSYNPTMSSFSDLGIISPGGDGKALTVADDGKVYGGYTNGNEGRLFVYDSGTGWITDKGQVLGQQSINALAAGPDGRIYGGTNTYNGAVGRFFAYDPANDSFVDLAGYYGGVYALVKGEDGRIYGAARRNGWEAYLFIYDPTHNTLRETGRIKDGSGHVSALAWTSDDRVYGTQTEGWHPSYYSDLLYNLVVYDPANSEFNTWDQVAFEYTAPAGTAVRIDVLDAQGNTLLTDVKSGDSLSSIDPATHPALQLRANLSGNGSNTPLIDSWAVRVVVPWPLYTISGRVADANNDPIAGVTISAGAGGSATTDASGAYTITDLIAGTCVVRPQTANLSPAARVVRVPPSASDQDFTTVPVYGTLTGQVTAQDSGNAVATNARVSAGGKVGRTDANGIYILTDILPGIHTIYVSADGYEDYKSKVTIKANISTTA